MHPLRWKGLIKKKLWKSKPIVDRSDSLKDEIIVDFFWIDSLEGWLKRGDN